MDQIAQPKPRFRRIAMSARFTRVDITLPESLLEEGRRYGDDTIFIEREAYGPIRVRPSPIPMSSSLEEEVKRYTRHYKFCDDKYLFVGRIGDGNNYIITRSDALPSKKYSYYITPPQADHRAPIAALFEDLLDDRVFIRHLAHGKEDDVLEGVLGSVAVVGGNVLLSIGQGDKHKRAELKERIIYFGSNMIIGRAD
jgi:hypothetical protein